MNTKKSVWQRILLSQHYRWSVWNFQIAAAMVNGCWLSKDIHWYLLWMSMRVSGDQATKRPSDQDPFLRAAFETVFKKELQNESSLNICWVVGNSFTCKVDLSVTFFLSFFFPRLCLLFFSRLFAYPSLRRMFCTNHITIGWKKKGKMGKNKYDKSYLQYNVFNVWRKKRMTMLNNLDEEWLSTRPS